jgi:Rap1a immunity proteins
MRPLFIAAFAVLMVLAATRADAQEKPANTASFLVQRCQTAVKLMAGSGVDEWDAGVCMGYVRGVHETLVSVARECPERLAANIPADVTVEQLIRAFLQYGADHPKRLQEPMLTVLVDSWLAAWPSAKKEK